MPSQLDSRQTLRHQLRQNRRNLSADEQLIAANSILTSFKCNFLDTNFLAAQHTIKNVALYLSNDGEISPHLLCEHLWQQDIQTYLPVVQDKQLKFALYSSQTIWKKNRYGIKEPMTESYLPKESLDIVLMPLVGFDENGGRLGMGGGFYDKTFAEKTVGEAPWLVGLAHNCQQVKSLPIEEWDVPLQVIITPTKLIKVP